MEYNKGLVSIVIPTYKRAEMLSRAISSCLEQTYRNIEVLVVSDNEPDDEYTQKARETVDSFHDSRLQLITQDQHINGAVARNVGIRAAKGDYISFLDDDDYIDSEKIEKQIAALYRLDDSWGGVCCRYKVYKKGRLVEVAPMFKSGYVYKEVLMRLIKTQTNSLLLKRDSLIKAGLFDETLLRHQDVQLLTRFTYHYKLKCMDDFLNNLDQDDNMNRVNPDCLMTIKKAFFNSVQDIIASMSPMERFRLKLLTQFDIGILYIQNGQLLSGLVRCLSIVCSPVAMFQAINKVFEKKQMRKLALKLRAEGLYPYRNY